MMGMRAKILKPATKRAGGVFYRVNVKNFRQRMRGSLPETRCLTKTRLPLAKAAAVTFPLLSVPPSHIDPTPSRLVARAVGSEGGIPLPTMILDRYER